VLRYASETPDARLGAVAAICPPLELERAVSDMDARSRWPYRRHVLGALRAMLAPIAARGRLVLSLDRLRAIRSFAEWDELVVVPRFGFADRSDYYQRASVAPRLDRVRVPALIVATRADPMVLAGAIEEALSRHRAAIPPAMAIAWLDGAGHVGFPPSASLGIDGARGLEPQVLAWLAQRLDALHAHT
jgi:predicted alpha/beta-fold hydrolase